MTARGFAPDLGAPSLDAGGVACTHCRTPLAGRYCHTCGQDSVPDETALPSWRDHWGKVGRTMVALVFRPGLLTREHLTGARIRYVAPLTLFLNCVAVFFLFSMVTDFRFSTFLERQPAPWLEAEIAARTAATHVPREVFLERAEKRFQGVYTVCVSLISLVGYTIFARLFFWRQWRSWRGPFAFALHYLAFVFVVYMPFTMAEWRYAQAHPAWPRGLGFATQLVLVGAYLTLAVRRIFGASWPISLAKGCAIMVLGFPVNYCMFLATLWLTVALA